jgi:hypothetical protein
MIDTATREILGIVHAHRMDQRAWRGILLAIVAQAARGDEAERCAASMALADLALELDADAVDFVVSKTRRWV